MTTAATLLDSRRLGSCPVPSRATITILLGHGSGGRLTAELIQRVFLPAFDNDVLAALEDQAIAAPRYRQWQAGPRLAFTTDSFVVRPLFFPGGDIGRLAVHGTVNDLAVGGALPLLSLGRLHPGGRSAARRSAADRRVDASARATRRA